MEIDPHIDLRPGAFVPPRRLGGLDFSLDQRFPDKTVDSCLALYLTWEFWIARKIYRFSFVDAETVVHRVRWEMELPTGLPVLPNSNRFLVPVGIFEPGLVLTGLSVTDDQGSEVPLLTSRENTLLLEQMVERSEPLGTPDFDPDLSVPDESERPSKSPGSLASALLKHELGGRAPRGYLQVAMMKDPSMLRRSLTVEYETQLSPAVSEAEKPYSKPLLDLFSTSPDDYEEISGLSMASARLAATWPISGLGDAARAHVECVAPSELEIDDSFGFWRSASTGRFEEIERKNSTSRAYLRPKLGALREGQTRSENRYADLSLSHEEDPEPTRRGQPALLTVILSPKWEELKDSFLALGIGSVLLLLASAFVLMVSGPEVESSKSILATVVAFTSSISTSILLRPNSHEMAGFLLKPVRLRLALIGLMPILAAISLAIPVAPSINGLILFLIALLEAAYARYCYQQLEANTSDSASVTVSVGEATRLTQEARLWIVRDAEMVRDYQLNTPSAGGQQTLGTPITKKALAGAAREFADSAGWDLEEI